MNDCGIQVAEEWMTRDRAWNVNSWKDLDSPAVRPAMAQHSRGVEWAEVGGERERRGKGQNASMALPVHYPFLMYL